MTGEQLRERALALLGVRSLPWRELSAPMRANWDQLADGARELPEPTRRAVAAAAVEPGRGR